MLSGENEYQWTHLRHGFVLQEFHWAVTIPKLCEMLKARLRHPANSPILSTLKVETIYAEYTEDMG